MRDHHPYTIVAARFLPPTRFSAHNAGSFFAMPIQCLLVLFIMFASISERADAFAPRSVATCFKVISH